MWVIMFYMIVGGLILFTIKRFLLRTKLFSKDMIRELKTQVKDQQNFIDYQTNKIIELQNMILNSGSRIND